MWTPNFSEDQFFILFLFLCFREPTPSGKCKVIGWVSYETHPNYINLGLLQAFRGRILTEGESGPSKTGGEFTHTRMDFTGLECHNSAWTNEKKHYISSGHHHPALTKKHAVHGHETHVGDNPNRLYHYICVFQVLLPHNIFRCLHARCPQGMQSPKLEPPSGMVPYKN